MRKIKVLRIIARLNIGGPAIHTILLSEGLDKSRFETVLVCGTPEKSEGDMLYLAEEKGVRPIIIPELGRSLNFGKDIIVFWKLFCLIKKEKPDIIHTHTAKAGTLGRLAGLLFKLTYVLRPTSYDLKLIHTFHGHVLHSYFGRVKSALFIWIERFLAIFTDKIIAVSENLREELVKLRIAKPHKIVVVPLGLELERYLKIENNGPGNRDYKSIGIIGRLVPVKNHKMFLDAAKKIKNALGFSQRMKFLIVGDGPLRQELESYAERLGISEDVSFTGWIRDLERVYSELDIVTLTSLNEGTPVALIEAQAAGRPCVATNVGGVANVIEEGRSGILIPFEDVGSFAQAIIKLLSNPGLVKAMGEYGRDKVRDKFNKERLIKDIEGLYEETLCRYPYTLTGTSGHK
ncbi:MAG: glycosyltransferase family 4 protein [Candidatus Omnitrophica bacterium]|nr:glycosyltransferase family 4 protein [Candidatus Omnitrophota bacterium]